MDKLVDFSQPLVAEHADGSVESAEAAWRRSDGCWQVKWYRNGNPCIGGFTSEGNPLAPWDWRIRNTVKPSTPSNEELTQRMEIAPEVIERMNEAIRKFARYGAGDREDRTLYFSPRDFDVFRAIEADLPKPVDPIDPDLIEARKLFARNLRGDGLTEERERLANTIMKGEGDNFWYFRPVVEAIKLGRTLAAGGTAHE